MVDNFSLLSYHSFWTVFSFKGTETCIFTEFAMLLKTLVSLRCNFLTTCKPLQVRILVLKFCLWYHWSVHSELSDSGTTSAASYLSVIPSPSLCCCVLDGQVMMLSASDWQRPLCLHGSSTDVDCCVHWSLYRYRLLCLLVPRHIGTSGSTGPYIDIDIDIDFCVHLIPLQM